MRYINRNDQADVNQTNLPIGKGMYGKCRLKMYQGNYVAVKEF